MRHNTCVSKQSWKKGILILMRKLKKIYRKKKIPGGDKLKYKPIIIKKLVKIKKIGKWCAYYPGRLPFPIECQWNSVPPLCHDRPNCIKCNRKVTWQPWRNGIWDKIKYAISQGENLMDMESPESEDKYEE